MGIKKNTFLKLKTHKKCPIKGNKPPVKDTVVTSVTTISSTNTQNLVPKPPFSSVKPKTVKRSSSRFSSKLTSLCEKLSTCNRSDTIQTSSMYLISCKEPNSVSKEVISRRIPRSMPSSSRWERSTCSKFFSNVTLFQRQLRDTILSSSWTL